MASSSSLSSGSSWKHDVFLSFRGEDTRKTFVDHLYSAFQQHGILTYKDDETLDRGDTIGPSLLKAIESSQILVIIFSENYVDFSWCLDELSHIMKCRDRDETGHIVMPIFYHVDPSDVRNQKRKYGEAFAKHRLSENNKKKVELWKKALVDASNIAGWEPKHVANGHEAKCIQEIVDSILGKLSSLDPVVEDEELVGMENRLKDLKSQLRIGSGGVRMVGIWGIGGGGKTTLATSLYMEISSQFDNCCFLDNIREESRQQNGLKNLQEKILSGVFGKKMQVESVDIGKRTIKRMLCRRNVLVVLDDVDQLDQLKALVGYHNWFGDGSRIIITTRDQHLLKTHKVDEVCPVSLLSHGEAIQLFRRHAYHENNPVEDYDKLSLCVISHANGLPLALKILGCFLYDQNKDEWVSTLSRLKDHPEMDIVEKLKITYDGLKPVEKELFLDIACFFRRRREKEGMKILDACGFHPCIGVKVLIQKALITVSKDGFFGMHDLVQEMGRYIVRGGNPKNPETYSRVWRNEDIEDICSRNATMENDKIEAIQCYDHVQSSNFIMLMSNMKKLRLLNVTTASFDKAPSFLSNELRYLSWSSYPASPFPESFQPTQLVVLNLKFSLQKVLWKGYKYLPCLKEMELYYFWDLVKTPDFGGLPCLQKLKLERCESLEEIHQSLGNHVSLAHVSVKECRKLRRFPTIVKMDKLKTLNISTCNALVEFPKIEANMDNLVKLSLCGVGNEILPSTIREYFTKGLGLRKLNISWCKLKDGDISNEIGELSNLRELQLCGNDFTRLDFSLSRLTRLKLLELSYCANLVELPKLPSSLAILKADQCESLEVIKDDAHRSCKWLSEVSIEVNRKNIAGDERLLESMLQGKAVKNGCMILQLTELEILRGFEPRLVRGERCRMQLPENWYNHFSGFLFCVIVYGEFDVPIITMEHVEKSVCGSLMGMEEETFYVDDDDDVNRTCVTYFPFSLLRHTTWWDPTSTAVEMDFITEISRSSKCGLKLVPKGAAAESETTPTHSSSYDDDDDYKCKLDVLDDSKSVFQLRVGALM